MLDGSGSVYVVGRALSANFPVTTGVYQPTNRTAGHSTGFVTRLNPTGTALLFSTYLGGTGADEAFCLALDGSGNVIVGGDTVSTDFPVTVGAVQATNRSIGNGFNGFVAKLNPTGTALLYGTYLGGTSTQVVGGVAVDGSRGTCMSQATPSPPTFQ